MVLAMTTIVFGGLSLISCSDEPDEEYFYTFQGEMMSDFLKNRSEYSEFAEIVERANLMDLLSSYGHYTCFAPSNSAVDAFLRNQGKSSVGDLSDADCDTIARTHLIPNMYSTIEMDQDRLQTANMLGRYLSTHIDSVTAEVVIEGVAHVSYTLKDDSVENGIVQPVDMVIQKSNSYIADILRENPNISMFYEALSATGVNKEILLVEDDTWDPKAYPKYYYKSHTWSEVAWVPDTKKYGFTVFVEKDEVYKKALQNEGISLANGNLRALYELARRIYDPIYGSGSSYRDDTKDGWKFENLTDSINPLKRFVRYHILNRYVPGASDLTPLVMNVGSTHDAFGIDGKLINPVDWYVTLLPYTMIKVEHATLDADNIDAAQRYVNRRYDTKFQHKGALIDASKDIEYEHDAINGHYFYVDEIVSFSEQVRDEVQNMRIRMDFSAIFPEVMTNDMRLKGIPTADDSNTTPDDAAVPKNGRNYYFPLGYIDGLSFTNCYFVMRRPHTNFWSWQGDEWNIFGDYDFTFRIPPVPKTGTYQLRLGFCALETRGVMQVYFDGVPQGIPLDMTKFLDSELYIGDRFKTDEACSDYDGKSVEEKAEEQKLLRNLGAYRAGRSTFHFSPSDGTKYYFTGNPRTYRRILCQTTITANEDHYLRFRVASDGKQGNNNEFMLDYFEIVPSSVYAVDGEGEMEDDL
jgi:uncharacterized surface protein with fasciclin (FAS1) repeats